MTNESSNIGGPLDSGERLDAAQFAMHGLLCIYFDGAIDRSPQRVEAILDRAAREAGYRPVSNLPRQRASSFVVRHKWIAAIGSLATAAAILIGFGLVLRSTPVRADIYADAAVAGSAWFRLMSSFDLVIDKESPEARAQLRELTRLEHEVRHDIEQIEQHNLKGRSVTTACQKWQAYYCLLRDLGKREDAIREVEAAVAFSRSQPDQPFLPVYLDGLGNVYAAFCEYDAARKAYLDSIQVRRDDYAKAARNEPSRFSCDPHWKEPGYEGYMWQAMTPMYLRLMRLAMAKGDLQEARAWQAKADRILAQFFIAARELASNPAKEEGRNEPDAVRNAPNGAGLCLSMWECWQALPAEYRQPKKSYAPDELRSWVQGFSPSTSLCAWVRTVLYFEALLQCAEGNHSAAQLALDRAASVPDFPDASEFKLPFMEGLQRARLEIIHKDYASALKAVAAARLYLLDPSSSATEQAPAVNRLPLRPMDIAEMNLLEGVARLGVNCRDPEGRELVKSALAIPVKLAEELPPEQREAFLKQFEPWRNLLNKVMPAQPVGAEIS